MTDNPNGDDVGTEASTKPPWCGVHTEAVVSFRATCPEDDWKGQVRTSKSDAHKDAQEHNRDHHRRKQRCLAPLGERPSWMSPDQYDPCCCDLPPNHDGDCECEHTRSQAASVK